MKLNVHVSQSSADPVAALAVMCQEVTEGLPKDGNRLCG
jgi:hypothetical protein